MARQTVNARIDGLMNMLMKASDRHQELDQEVGLLRGILAGKGVVTHEEFDRAEAAWKQHLQELRAQLGLTPDEVQADELRKFQGGPKQ